MPNKNADNKLKQAMLVSMLKKAKYLILILFLALFFLKKQDFVYYLISTALKAYTKLFSLRQFFTLATLLKVLDLLVFLFYFYFYSS